VESSDIAVETARAGHLPTLYFTGSYGESASWGETSFTGNNFSSTFPLRGESRGPTFGLALRIPIFSGGAVSSQVRQAAAQRDVATDEMEQQKRALERNTRNSYQTLVAGISEVEARRLALLSARSAYSASQVGLEVGTRTVIDVLINQQNLFNAQREFALARYNFLQNRLLLEQAAGTLDINDIEDVNRLLTVDADAQLAPGDTATNQ
jgi:outer membrane protein